MAAPFTDFKGWRTTTICSGIASRPDACVNSPRPAERAIRSQSGPLPQFGAACPEIYTALESEGAQRFGFAARVACRTVGERVWPGLRYQWESIWERRSQSWHTSTERGDRARF